jgi:hypothetical protein
MIEKLNHDCRNCHNRLRNPQRNCIAEPTSHEALVGTRLDIYFVDYAIRLEVPAFDPETSRPAPLLACLAPAPARPLSRHGRGHVGCCRKAEQFQKLGASEMVRVKSIIDKEVGKFERTLRREFRPYWKPRQSVPLRFELLSNNVSCVLLDLSLPDIERLVGTMVQARDAVGRRPWSHSAEPTVGRHPGRSPRA